MAKEQLTLKVLNSSFGICRLAAAAKIPNWFNKEEINFYSITRSKEELSIVCPEKIIPKTIQAELGWRALKVKGPLDFNLTGILSSIAKPLADNSISIFAVSTYNTDYILIRREDFTEAVEILKNDFAVE